MCSGLRMLHSYITEKVVHTGGRASWPTFFLASSARWGQASVFFSLSLSSALTLETNENTNSQYWTGDLAAAGIQLKWFALLYSLASQSPLRKKKWWEEIKNGDSPPNNPEISRFFWRFLAEIVRADLLFPFVQKSLKNLYSVRNGSNSTEASRSFWNQRSRIFIHRHQLLEPDTVSLTCGDTYHFPQSLPSKWCLGSWVRYVFGHPENQNHLPFGSKRADPEAWKHCFQKTSGFLSPQRHIGPRNPYIILKVLTKGSGLYHNAQVK